MKILVDTSVWVDFLNGHPSPHAEALSQLLMEEAELVTCGLIVAEVLQGLRTGKQFKQIERHLLDMEWLTPEEPFTYLAASDLFRQLRARGKTIRSTVDCVIAVLSARNDALLLSKDRDLRIIADSKLIDARMIVI